MSTVQHRGAGPRSMPKRLSPRRTSRVLGIRCTPRVSEGFVGGLGASILLVACTDLPTRLMEALIR